MPNKDDTVDYLRDRNELLVILGELVKMLAEEPGYYWHPAVVAARVACRMRIE